MTNRPPFQVCLFEDLIATTLFPYQLTRPLYTVPFGVTHLLGQLLNVVSSNRLSVIAASYHIPYLHDWHPNISVNLLNKALPTLFINARLHASQCDITDVLTQMDPEKNHVFIHHGQLVAVYSTRDYLTEVYNLLSTNPTFDEIIDVVRERSIVQELTSARLPVSWNEWLSHIAQNISHDFLCHSRKGAVHGSIASFTKLKNDSNMMVCATVAVSDYVVLDATTGPILLQEGVHIEPFSLIKGPCVIGQNSIVRAHSMVSNSIIGDYCKVSGEVSNVILQSFSNKAHAGFLGDSIIGEWVNLGAGTTVSNLKLTYGMVPTYSFQKRNRVETDAQFLGILMGDHVKTAVSSVFSCGAVVSSFSSLLGSECHDAYIPPFTFGEPSNYRRQETVALLHAIQRMMARRNHTLSDAQKQVIELLHKDVSRG